MPITQVLADEIIAEISDNRIFIQILNRSLPEYTLRAQIDFDLNYCSNEGVGGNVPFGKVVFPDSLRSYLDNRI